MKSFVCRICLQIFAKHDLSIIYNIADMVMACTNVSISKNDGLPAHICKNCEINAINCYNFKSLCENSDKLLRRRSNENMLKGIHCVDFDLFERNITNTINENKEETTSNKSIAESAMESSNSKSNNKLKIGETVNTDENKCPLCCKDCSTKSRLINHINTHNRRGSHLCQICGKQFTLPENLVRHQKLHSNNRPFQCDICNKTFTRPEVLKNHIVTHSLEKSYLCTFCGNRFTRMLSLKIHVRRLHMQEAEKHLCSCGKSFKDRRDLSQHKLIHKGRKYICDICNKGFNRPSNLKIHKRIHTGLKSFSCEVCQFSFTQKISLQKHMKTHEKKE